MNEAIRLAIEKGGYRNLEGKSEAYITMATNSLAKDKTILLDSLFWRALGKALGWKNLMRRPYPKVKVRLEHDGNVTTEMTEMQSTTEWLYHQHRFIDHIAEGKSPDDFFKQLINKQ